MRGQSCRSQRVTALIGYDVRNQPKADAAGALRTAWMATSEVVIINTRQRCNKNENCDMTCDELSGGL